MDYGFNTLAGTDTDTDKIISLANGIGGNENIDFSKRLYGNGDAGQTIIDNLK